MIRHVFVLAAAVTLASCGLFKSPTDPGSGTGVLPNVVNYTAVGASDAIGFGSSVVCAPFTVCPNGMGYVQLIQRRLTSDGKTGTFVNLGLPGAVLNPEIEAIGNSLNRQIPGNFLDSEENFVPTDSTLVTIFAGGNDANTIGAAVDAGLGGSDPNGYVQTEIQHYGRDLATLVTTIQTRAPGVRVVVLNLPNLAALPYAAGDSLSQKRGLQQIAVGLSAQANAMTSKGALVVDLMCDSNFYNPSSFSSDGFHPNDAGYAYLANVIYPVATTGQASAPLASCAQMTIY